MNPLLCVLTFLGVMMSSHFGLVAQDTKQAAVGRIVELGCKKSWRKDANGKEQRLDPKRDQSREIFVDESYRCEGKGVLKLIVHSRPVDVVEATGWFPIGKNAGENKENTAGPPGDELAWLEGTYRLNTDESNKATQGGEKFLADLTAEQQQKLNEAFGLQLVSLKSFTVIPQNETVNILLAHNAAYSFKADGVIREQQLPDGTDLKYMVKAEPDKLLLSSFGNYFKADMRVEPKEYGQKLFVTRTVYFIGQSQPVSWTAIYDREQQGQMKIYGVHGLKSTAAIPFDTVTAELQEIITTEGLTVSNFSLRVTAPTHLAGGIITGRISKTTRDPATGEFRLNVDFDSIRSPAGITEVFRGKVKQILSPTGGVVAQEADLVRRRVVPDRRSAAAAEAPGAEPQATYSLNGPLILEKGSKIELYSFPNP